MAPPLKLTAAVQAEICKSIASGGVDPETAALREGVSRATYYLWQKRGRAGDEPYAAFVRAVDQALASCEVEVTGHVIKAARRQWQAGAWWLKWRANKGSERLDVNVRQAGGGGHLTPEAAQVIRERILFADRTRQLPERTVIDAEIEVDEAEVEP